MSTRRRNRDVILTDGPVDVLPSARDVDVRPRPRSASPSDAPNGQQTVKVAAKKVADILKFPLCVLLSLTISAACFSFMANFSSLNRDLAAVSRSLNDDWAVTSVLALRIVELAVGWYGNYDDMDLLALTLLTHLPYFYLLTTFYGISVVSACLSLVIDVLAICTPFSLLRSRNPSHTATTPRTLPARPIVTDDSIRILVILLAAAIYSVVVYGSFYTWLPVYLVVHFEGLRDISAAHEAALPMLVPSFVPIGWAAREFFFSPTVTGAAGTQNSLAEAKAKVFNPETATLGETLRHNLLAYSKRTKVLMRRAATLVLMCGMNAGLRTFASIEGTEPWGAMGWAALWATAGVITAAMFGWVGTV